MSDKPRIVQAETAIVKALVVRTVFMDTVFVLLLPVTELGNDTLMVKPEDGECVGQICMN